MLSTYPLLTETLGRLQSCDDAQFDAEIGVLIARLSGLRRMCWEVAEALDHGRAPVVQAATLKYLGTAFEVDVIEFARTVGFTTLEHDSLSQAWLAAPGFSIRGGSSDVLLSIIAKAEVKGRS